MNTQIQTVARAFVESLRERLTAAQWDAMVAANAAETDPNICHSHDYFDANEYMAGAISDVDGTPDAPERPEDEDAYFDLWNAAWNHAKTLMQSNISSATFEHPGYVDITLVGGGAVHVGRDGIDYYDKGVDHDRVDAGIVNSAEIPGGIDVGEVVSVDTLHGGGNCYADYVVLETGCCILVTTDGVYVYRTEDEARSELANSVFDQCVAELFF